MAETYFNPRAIVIGHLNHLPVTNRYGQLLDIIRARNLRTVTLDDVLLRPGYGREPMHFSTISHTRNSR
jgi:hypothetical protein